MQPVQPPRSVLTHSVTGEWEKLVRAAGREQDREIAHVNQMQSHNAELQHLMHSPGNMPSPQQATGSSPYTLHNQTYANVMQTPAVPNGSSSRYAPNTAPSRQQYPSSTSFHSPSAAPITNGHASPNPSSSSSFSPTAAFRARAPGNNGPVVNNATVSLLQGVNHVLRMLQHMAQGEQQADRLRAKLHATQCVRPVSQENVNYPGLDGLNLTEADSEAIRGGFKPGSWISKQHAHVSQLFRKKMHTQHHAFASLPAGAGGDSVFIPNTFLLWLLFTNLDTAGKGYISVEDYALFLSKFCRTQGQGTAGARESQFALTGDHAAQKNMEDYFEGVDDQEIETHTHFTPYYPHSPFHHHNNNQSQSPIRAPTLGVTSLKEARSFLSQNQSADGERNLHADAPMMPSPEDLLALFRKHDRASHGKMGFTHFCRAFVPLLQNDKNFDEFEASLAALPKQFSSYIEASRNPNWAAEKREQIQAAEWGTLNTVGSARNLLSRLTTEQEQFLVELLLHEIEVESALSFDALQLQRLGQGRGPQQQYDPLPAGFKSASSAPPTSSDVFDLIDIYEYLDRDIDGFLSISELQTCYAKFHISPTPQQMAYILYRLDRDNDGKMLYMDFAELFLPYAELLPYSVESFDKPRYINPFHQFPFSPNLLTSISDALIQQLLAESAVTARNGRNLRMDETEEERMERLDAEETDRMIADQTIRTEQLERKIRDDRLRIKHGAIVGYGTNGNGAQQSQEEKSNDDVPVQDKKRVSFGGVTGPSTPSGMNVSFEAHNHTPDPHQQQPQQVSSPGFSSPSRNGSNIIPAGLFHRPPPGAYGGLGGPGVTVTDIVQEMEPANLESQLPSGYPFVLHKPLSPASATDFLLEAVSPADADRVQRLRSGLDASRHSNDPMKQLSRVRMEQLHQHQQFAAQVAHQRSKQQQHTAEFVQSNLGAGSNHRLQGFASPLLLPHHAQSSSPSSSSAQARLISSPGTPHVRVHVSNPNSPHRVELSSSRGATASAATAVALASRSPSTSVHHDSPHVRAYTKQDGGVEVDVWYGDEYANADNVRSPAALSAARSHLTSSVVSSSGSIAPRILTATGSPTAAAAMTSTRITQSPNGIPTVYTDLRPVGSSPFSGPPPASASYASPATSSQYHPHISPPYASSSIPVVEDSTPARFAPTYPLRFPDETLASHVHQTLYFPIPLAVPSAMLPLNENRMANPKLADEINQSALVASLASAQSRVAETKQAEIRRIKEYQENVLRIQNAVHTQALSNAVSMASPLGSASAAFPSPVASASARTKMSHLAPAASSILPMNHQSTAANYALTAVPTYVSPMLTPGPVAHQPSEAVISALQSGINSSIYSRPVTPSRAAFSPAAVKSPQNMAAAHFQRTAPIVDFAAQQQLQSLALESIHAHRLVLATQDAALRQREEEQHRQQLEKGVQRAQEELKLLQETHQKMAAAEREAKYGVKQVVHPVASAASEYSSSSATPPPPRKSFTDLHMRHGTATPSPSPAASSSSAVPVEQPVSNFSVAPIPQGIMRGARAFSKGTLPPPSSLPSSAATPGKVALLNLRDLASPSPAVARQGKATVDPSQAAVRNLSASFQMDK